MLLFPTADISAQTFADWNTCFKVRLIEFLIPLTFLDDLQLQNRFPNLLLKSVMVSYFLEPVSRGPWLRNKHRQ